MWGIAVVQPILFVLAANTDYFLRNGIVGWRAIMFGVGFALVPPLIVTTIEIALLRIPRASSTLHLTMVGLLGVTAILQFVKYGANFEGPRLYLTALAASGIAVLLWVKLAFLREWLRWLSVVPLIVAVIFVFFSPVGRFARAGDGRLIADSGSTTPVVMVMFDEFPLASLMDGSGSIDATSYPNFARLAGMSTWYRMYSTTTEETQFAVPTSLSGVAARARLGATYADHPETIFSLLGRSHLMHVTEWITRLCPPAACRTATPAPRWNTFFHGVTSLIRQRIDGTIKSEFDNVSDNPILDDRRGKDLVVPERDVEVEIPNLFRNVFTDWIAEITSSERPVFHYVHVLLPHQPWILAPNGDVYTATVPKSVEEEGAWDVRVLQQRHLLQLRFLDSQIGILLDRLQAEGLLDDALVVVTADHGASFVPNHLRRYAVGDYSNATEIMSVPLFIKTPGQSGGVIDDSNVDNEDLLSLITSRLGVSVPWRMDGSLPGPESGATKTLRFVVPPIGQKTRPDPGFTISLGDFRDEVMSFGTAGVPGDPLSFLYLDTPHDDLRGRSVSSLRGRLSTVEVRLGAEIASATSFVVVEGEAIAVPEGAWIAVAAGGRVVGLAPVGSDGRFVTMALGPDGSPVSDLSFHLVD